jgi:PAS domain S-box-containing protein
MRTIKQPDVERKKSAESLREDAELFQGVFNQAAVGIVITGPDRLVIKANRKICEFLGCEVDELIGRRIRDATHPDFVPGVDEQIRKLVAGEVESATIENLYLRKDGTTAWGEWTSSLVRDEQGAPKYFISIIQNIDERKEAAAEAENTRHMLEHSQQVAHLGSWDLDIATFRERWSDEIYRIFGLEPQSIHFDGYGFLEYVHPDDREITRKAQDEAIALHKPYCVQYRIVRPDGTERTVYEYAELEFNDDGEPVRLAGTIQDITERKRAENALRRTTSQLEEAQRLAHVGNWELDPHNGRSEWSEELYRIFGLTPRDEPPAREFVLTSIIHKADRVALERAMGDTLRTGAPYATEFRIVRPDGEVRTVFEHGERYVPEDTNLPRLRGVLQDITELKQTEQELREVSRRLELAQNQAKVGYWRWSFEEGRLTYWSEGAAQISQYPSDEMTPKTYEEMLAPIHPGDRARVEAEFKAADEERRDFSMEYRVLEKDGRVRHVREIGEVEYDEAGKPVAHVGIVQDITELKQMEEELRRSERRLNAFFEEAPAGLVLYDRQGRYFKANETIARMNGVPASEHEGKRPSDFLPSAMAQTIEEANRRTLETGEKQVNVEISGTINSSLDEPGYFVYSRFPITGPDGEVLGVGAVVVDITERKSAEQELSRLNAELEQRVEKRTAELRAAQEELLRRERLATLGQLTATVSHELRNPLGAMRSSIYVVEKKLESADARLLQAVARISRSISRCDRIIDELLDFTRIRELEIRSIDLDDWLCNVLNELPVPKGIRIERQFGAQGATVPADPDSLRRAVINVYDNACQAMQGAELDTGPRLTVRTGICGGRAEIIIADNGPGIPQDKMDRIFEPLFSTKSFGIGLGLPVVRQIMEKHGGAVEAGASQEGGARFTLWLPSGS